MVTTSGVEPGQVTVIDITKVTRKTSLEQEHWAKLIVDASRRAVKGRGRARRRDRAQARGGIAHSQLSDDQQKSVLHIELRTFLSRIR